MNCSHVSSGRLKSRGCGTVRISGYKVSMSQGRLIKPLQQRRFYVWSCKSKRFP
nr:MAG TPA: hypothetical protein [Caudoviricetes sp.]